MPEHNTEARYEQMSVDELCLEATSFERMLKTFLIIAGYPNDLKYNVDVRAVVEIYSGLMNFGEMKTIPKKDSEIHKNLLYAFKYRELPQDSIMTLVYSLCKI